MSNSSTSFFNKLPASSMRWLMPLLLSGLMSATLSCINMWLSQGISEGFFNAWLNRWLLSWVIAYPLILIFIPLVQKSLMFIVDLPHAKPSK